MGAFQAHHLITAFAVAGVGPMRGVPVQPQCWDRHAQVSDTLAELESMIAEGHPALRSIG